MPISREDFDAAYGHLERHDGGPSTASREYGWGDRFGAAIDSAQAGLYGVLEAGGNQAAADRRRANQAGADFVRQRAAEDTNTPLSFRDVDGVGSGARWVGGLLVDTAPHLATIAAAGAMAGPLGMGTAAGRMGLAAAAGYPFNVGDVLQNQREQAGRTDMGSAAALAVPYTALDMLGVEGALARGTLARNTIRALDEVPGVRGALARGGATTARTMAVEGTTETGQEAMNQLGRMAVDPNAELFSDEALDRYGESFAGGAAVGGVFGGAAGGWRRSAGYTPSPVRTVDQGTTDLLQQPEQRPALALSAYAPSEGPEFQRPQDEPGAQYALPLPGQYDMFNPDGTPTYAADPSFSDTNPLRPLEREWETAPGAAPPRQGGLDFRREIPTGNLGLVPLPGQETIDLFEGVPRTAPIVRPEFELTPPDMSGAGQVELDFQPPVAPTEPVLPQGRARGVTGQLPFSANTTSPKGQVLMGLVDSLAAEGHLDGGAGVQAATLIAKGQFAAAKKIVDEAVKNKTAADSMLAKAAKLEEKANADTGRAAEQRPANAAGSGRVQRDGSQRDAAGVQPLGTPAVGADARGGEDAPAVPADGQLSAALGEQAPAQPDLSGVTSEALVEVADQAKDIREYESSLDELYRRWRDDGDALAAGFFESNAKVRGFDADLRRVRERAGEAPGQPVHPKAPTNEGAHGLRLGRHPQGDLAPEAKETDSILRGLAMPRFSMRDGSAPTQQLSDSDFQAVTESVQAAVPGLPSIELADDPLSVGMQPPSAAEVPMGATTADGRIVIFRSGVASRIEALRTVFHELFHYGLRKVLPVAEYHATMDRLFDGDEQVRKLAYRWGRTEEAKARQAGGMSDRDLRSLAIEEALSDISEDLMTGDGLGSKVRPGTVRNVIRWLAEVADRLGMKPLAQWMRRATLTEAERFIKDTVAGASTDVAPVPGSLAERRAAGQAKPQEPAQVDSRFKTARNTPADNAIADSFAKVPYAQTRLGQWVQDALFNLRESPWALKWVTNDQIAEGYKHLKPVQDIYRATNRMAAAANRYLEQAAQTAKKWRALADDAQLAMQRVMLQSTMDEMHVSIKGADGKYLSAEEAWRHESNKHLEHKGPEGAKLRAQFGKLYQEFHALPPAAKAVHDQVRDELAKQHQDTLRALRKSIAMQYATQLRRALTDQELEALANSDAGVRGVFKDIITVAGTPGELRALERLYRSLRDLHADFGTLRGPYFPLVRFGDHVVVMKSGDLVALEATAQKLKADLQQLLDDAPPAADEAAEAHDARIAEARKAYNDALKTIAEAKQDERKYVVEFHESPAQAERARMALAEKFPGADVYRSVREDYYRALDGASPAFLKDLTQTLSAALEAGGSVSAEARDSALNAVRDMYLRRQPERSALRSELKRMSIEGVKDAQMLRGYAHTSRNGAWRVSRLLHAGEITEGLQALSADRRSADAKHVLNELKARFVGDLAPPEDNKLLRVGLSTTYFMHLGFNISYYLTNATQAWTTSLPIMGGRHGMVNAANSLTAASKDVIKLLSQATVDSIEENGKVLGLQLRLTDEQITSLAQDAGEADMLKRLTDDGVIDITIKHDLGALADGTGGPAGRLMELSSAIANYPELYNRLSTALAAYRMERARREGAAETDDQVQERAAKYAEDIVNRTHFNYSPENAPRMMRGNLGRMIFQFKRYQQGMIYLYAKLIKDAFGGDKDAQRALAYLLGMTVATGGVAALPIAAPMALAAKVLASAYPDDDEPQWMQEWYAGMKDAVGETAAQMLVKGLPTGAGLDLSGKLGHGNILNPVAFARTDGKDMASASWWEVVSASLLGPAAMMVGKQLEAAGLLLDGQYGKAAEVGAPTAIANAWKAWRREEQGLTTRSGDTIMEPEEFGLGAALAKGVGFETVKVTDTYDRRGAYLDLISNRKDARQALLRQYYEAVRAGDSDAMASVQDEIRAFNERQPADRVKPGDLAASIKQHARRAQETRGGMRVGKRDEDSYRRLSGE